MALIDIKKLNPRFTGSFILSGSSQSLVSNQVVMGSGVPHPSASLTVLMDD